MESSSNSFTVELKFLFQSEWMLVVTSSWISSSKSLDWPKCSLLEFIDNGRMIRRSTRTLIKREMFSCHWSNDSQRRCFVSNPRRRSPMMTFPNEPLTPDEQKVLHLKTTEQFVDQLLRSFSDILAKLISQFYHLERINSNIEKFSALDSESWTRAFNFSARFFWTSSRVQFDRWFSTTALEFSLFWRCWRNLSEIVSINVKNSCLIFCRIRFPLFVRANVNQRSNETEMSRDLFIHFPDLLFDLSRQSFRF